MFGSILAMSQSDVYVSIILCILVLLLYVLFYNRIFAITFDKNFSQATGVNANIYNMSVAVLTAITIVLGMRIMGALLISSLIIFPALSAMRLCRYFKGVIFLAALISVICFFFGIVFSYWLEIPVGASVVMVNLTVLLISILIEKIRKH
jgi:zinc transport system permease protein